METANSVPPITTLLCTAAFVLFVGIITLANGIRVVSEYSRLVVFRLGRFVGTKGPGLVLLIPIIDRAVTVDLREQKYDLPACKFQSKDHIDLTFSMRWSYKVIDPEKKVMNVGALELSASDMAVTILREAAKDMPAREILTSREALQQAVRAKLDEITLPWGVQTTLIEILDIQMPKDIQSALEDQILKEKVQGLVDSVPADSEGMTQTIVHANGRVIIGGRSWDAQSRQPILPNKKVHVERIILEVVEDPPR